MMLFDECVDIDDGDKENNVESNTSSCSVTGSEGKPVKLGLQNCSSPKTRRSHVGLYVHV